jgi:hypothetical protein
VRSRNVIAERIRRRVLCRPDHHGHPGGEMPFDMAVKKPETGVVLFPLNDRMVAGVDAGLKFYMRHCQAGQQMPWLGQCKAMVTV